MNLLEYWTRKSKDFDLEFYGISFYTIVLLSLFLIGGIETVKICFGITVLCVVLWLFDKIVENLQL